MRITKKARAGLPFSELNKPLARTTLLDGAVVTRRVGRERQFASKPKAW